MRLKLKNIGKIESADIEIAGITVIAGENDTGKSTVGKALWSVSNSFHDSAGQVRRRRVESIGRACWGLDVLAVSSSLAFSDYASLGSSLIDESDLDGDPANIRAKLSDWISSNLEIPERVDSNLLDDELDSVASRISDLLAIPSEEIERTLLTNKLNAEFGSQVNNVFHNEQGRIELVVRDEPATVLIDDDKVSEIQCPFALKTESLYLDDPLILDGLFPRPFLRNNADDHRSHLQRLLELKARDADVLQSILVADKLKDVYELIDSVCDGNIVSGKRGFEYREPGSEKKLNLKNISTGMKTFASIKMLLSSGAIGENGSIILDESEIHLHPAWQVLFAELVILLQKQFNLHVLITTHSPYFLQALEVYSEKHGIDENCRYYFARHGDRKHSVRFDNVTDDREPIYDTLAAPFQHLAYEEARL